MIKKLRLLSTLVILFLLAGRSSLIAQFAMTDENSGKFFFDAVCFKGSMDDSLQRIDAYVIIPYSSLRFEKNGEAFGAHYEMTIRVDDLKGNKIIEIPKDKKIVEKDYFITMGGSGSFDYSQNQLRLPAGNYNISAEIRDSHSGKTYRRSRKISILNFSNYPFSMSGILLVNAIEGIGEKYKITPHLSDNVGSLKEGFFLFYEIYNENDKDAVDFVYRILDKNGTMIKQSKKYRKALKKGTNQHFIKVELDEKFKQGEYLIRLFALKPSEGEEMKNTDILAIAERSFKFYHAMTGFVLQDLYLAVKQLVYACDSDEYEFIQNAPNEEEKRKRFDDFWKMKDPSPKTERNEAFEEYYGRIAIANKKFRSYTNGWKTDQGMVFIIYGAPYNVERYSSAANGVVHERWTYTDNRVFIFVDNSGFGNDFRLHTPMAVHDKYEFNY